MNRLETFLGTPSRQITIESTINLPQCSSQGSSREDRTRAEGHPQEFAAGYVSPPAT
jgi:hypothetical protein